MASPDLSLDLPSVPNHQPADLRIEPETAKPRIAFRLMQPSDVPAVVSLFAEHYSKRKDPFYPLRGLPFQYYVDTWRAVIAKCMAWGVVSVAVLTDHRPSGETPHETRWSGEGGKRELEVGSERVVCALAGMSFEAFQEIDEKDFKHGNREAERAVYDEMYEAFVRDPPCPLNRLFYIAGLVAHPSSQSKGVASQTTRLGLMAAATRGFDRACADILSNSAGHVATEKLGFRPFKSLRAPFRSVVLRNGTRPLERCEDVPEYAVIVCKDISVRSWLARSRL